MMKCFSIVLSVFRTKKTLHQKQHQQPDGHVAVSCGGETNEDAAMSQRLNCFKCASSRNLTPSSQLKQLKSYSLYILLHHMCCFHSFGQHCCQLLQRLAHNIFCHVNYTCRG